MKEKNRQRIQAVVALLILVAGAAGAVWVVLWLVDLLMTLDPNVAAAIVAGVVTVTVSVFSVVLSRRLEARAIVANELREKKVPVYERLIKFMALALLGDKVNKKPTECETMEFLLDFSHDLMIWGSDDVLREFIRFRNRLITGAAKQPTEVLFHYERLIYQIREDLGHKNKDLKRGDVLSLFVNDIHEYL